MLGWIKIITLKLFRILFIILMYVFDWIASRFEDIYYIFSEAEDYCDWHSYKELEKKKGKIVTK